MSKLKLLSVKFQTALWVIFLNCPSVNWYFSLMPNALLGYPLYITLKTEFFNSSPLTLGLIAFSVKSLGLPNCSLYKSFITEPLNGGVAFVTLKQ